MKSGLDRKHKWLASWIKTYVDLGRTARADKVFERFLMLYPGGDAKNHGGALKTFAAGVIRLDAQRQTLMEAALQIAEAYKEA